MPIPRWSAIQSALKTAAHKSTDPHVALTALQAANSLLSKGGKSLGDLILDDDDAPSKTPYAMLSQIERLEAELKQCRKAGIDLRAENERLNSKRAAFEAKIRSLTDELLVAKAAKTARQPDPSGETERLRRELAEEVAHSESWERGHADVTRKLNQALSDLSQERKNHVATQQALAAARAQPTVPGATIQQLQRQIEEKHRIIQYLGRILDNDLFKRLVDQGRNHANNKPLKRNTWPKNPDEILGDFEWGTRGKPKKAKRY